MLDLSNHIINIQEKCIAIVYTFMYNKEKVMYEKERCHYGKVSEFICKNRARNQRTG